ncbi:hypothetical protein ACVWXN_000340 [Bradyrhizobium sp. i1.4.4]
MKLSRCALALAIILPCAAFAQGGGGGGSGGGSAGGGAGGAASSGAGDTGTSSPSATNAAGTAGSGPANPAGTVGSPGNSTVGNLPPQRRSPASITNRSKGSTPKAKLGRAAPMRPAPLLPRALRPRLRRPRLPEGSEGLRPPTSRIATPRSIKRTATRTEWWGRSAKTANEHRVDPHVGAFFDGADFR